MPSGFLGRYLRYSDRMEVYGPDLGMPHTRAMGDGLFRVAFEIRRRDRTSFLLYNDWSNDCDAAPIYQKIKQNPAKRT